jgi:carbon storage regulator CsrA
MLVLRRRWGESIIIGGPASVALVGVDHGQDILGIEAGRNVPIDREEVGGVRRRACAAGSRKE